MMDSVSKFPLLSPRVIRRVRHGKAGNVILKSICKLDSLDISTTISCCTVYLRHLYVSETTKTSATRAPHRDTAGRAEHTIIVTIVLMTTLYSITSNLDILAHLALHTRSFRESDLPHDCTHCRNQPIHSPTWIPLHRLLQITLHTLYAPIYWTLFEPPASILRHN